MFDTTRIVFALLTFALLSCCSSDATEKSGGTTNTHNDSGTADVGNTRDLSPGDTTEVPTSCEQLGFVASGTTCESCQLTCDCPGDFPISLAHCTDDGCLTNADCGAVCRAGLEFAFDCTDVYSAPLADGEPCARRAECESTNCIMGRCASMQTRWSRAFHTTPVAGELQNEVEVIGLAVDPVGVRAAVYSKFGSSLDGSVQTIGKIVGLDRTGEVRFNAGFPGRVESLDVVDEDSLVSVRFERTVSVGDETYTPDDDDDWYVARITNTSDIVWSQHLVGSRLTTVAVLAGNNYVVAYRRGTDELVVSGFSTVDGASAWETVIPTAGSYVLSMMSPDSNTALLAIRTTGETTIGSSSLADPGTVLLRVDASNGGMESSIREDHATPIGRDANDILYFIVAGVNVRATWTDRMLGEFEPLARSLSTIRTAGGFTSAIVGDGWATEELGPGVVRVDPTGPVWWIPASLPRLSKVAIADDGTMFVGAAGGGVDLNGEAFEAPGPVAQRASLFFFELGP